MFDGVKKMSDFVKDIFKKKWWYDLIMYIYEVLC